MEAILSFIDTGTGFNFPDLFAGGQWLFVQSLNDLPFVVRRGGEIDPHGHLKGIGKLRDGQRLKLPIM